MEPGIALEFTPVSAVWEITMACNMRCAHCGSSCTTALPDELTTDEALDLCDQIADLGLQKVTLSGGEPLLRADWPLLAERLTTQGVCVTMISNGWLMSRAAIESARRSGVDLIGISVDGLEATHDAIRKPGSYRRALEALSLMRLLGLPSGVITTIVKRNLDELPGLLNVLLEHEVRLWQLQFGSAIGSLAGRREEWLAPGDAPGVLDFAAEVARETPLILDLADCVGYYTRQEREARRKRGQEDAVWAGCPAGKRTFGIRHNGDISACNAIRDGSAFDGNIREATLRSIWTRHGAFQWHRERTKESLTGLCRECQFSALCLAGCTSVRRSLCGGSDGEYEFCAYRLALKGLFDKVDLTEGAPALIERADRAMELGLPDVARRCLARAIHLDPDHQAAAARLAEVTRRLERDWDEPAAAPG
jgi:radical SAM protein with 4Fe4S-binding SPASM domain